MNTEKSAVLHPDSVWLKHTCIRIWSSIAGLETVVIVLTLILTGNEPKEILLGLIAVSFLTLTLFTTGILLNLLAAASGVTVFSDGTLLFRFMWKKFRIPAAGKTLPAWTLSRGNDKWIIAATARKSFILPVAAFPDLLHKLHKAMESLEAINY